MARARKAKVEVEPAAAPAPFLVRIELPYPPSVNHYYRNVGGRVLISAAGRRYRTDVTAAVLLAGVKTVPGRLSVEIHLFPPDRRARDIDNVGKAVLDSLQHAGVYESDSQIDDLVIRRKQRVPGGKLFVTVEPARAGHDVL